MFFHDTTENCSLKNQYWFSSLCLGNVLSPDIRDWSGDIIDYLQVFVPMFRECSFTIAQLMGINRGNVCKFSSLCLGNVLSHNIDMMKQKDNRSFRPYV